MLISNLDVERRFANGTQGRLLTWHPDKVQQQKKAISAACHALSYRFAKEASATKPEMLADVDFLDVTVRPRLSVPPSNMTLVRSKLVMISADPRSRNDE